MQTSAHDEGIRNLIEDSGLSAATQEFAGSAYLDKLSQDKKTELLSFQNSDLGKTVIVGWLNAGVNVVFGQAHDQVALAYLSTHCDGAH
ncbi:hypothetical protein C7417_4748 [Cupriavidus plantarum]|uniref:Uncharacterized protein n=2 Tax=Cupriavidus plantarum TaxID=942865 RepID=A0A316EYR1_9BURK|nr:hypothetical protein C7419_1011680 [Cupriavidus plantarum]RLK31768.1 hypothetical protein C7417_4748 [Cupriavidus plantarum]